MILRVSENSFTSSLLDALLQFSKDFDCFSILNSNNDTSEYVLIAAFGAKRIINELDQITLDDQNWKFGYLSYDLKNKFEKLQSQNTDRINAPDLQFFVPEIIVIKRKEELEIISDSIEKEQEIFEKLKSLVFAEIKWRGIEINSATSKVEYISNLGHIKNYIKRGAIYEMNYCIEFFADDVDIDPSSLYKRLNSISEAPFSFYFRSKDLYAIGSSPERFIKKENSKIITQPIKGTAPRSSDIKIDEELKQQLHNSEKERNENVMIVDVSRNDLSRVAKRGSVKVEELFGIYSFRQVHQMISTVSCELQEGKSFKDIMQAAFPPASMTGAPKIRAMQIIDRHENFKRGIYSGAVGFINDKGNFDFNVVIRTILYNSQSKELSYAVGSAITDKCDPEKEYEECLLKAAAMKQVLQST